MYYLFRIATIIIPRLPRKVALLLSTIVGLLAWLLARKARKQATINMLHVLGPQVQTTPAGRRLLRRTVRGMFQNSVRNYLEVFSLPHIQPETILNTIQVEGVEHLEAALALGKGVILFAAHHGPFEYLIQWLATKGYEVYIPVENLKDQRLLQLMLKLRCSHGLHFIPLVGSSPMRTIVKQVRQNRIVLLTADRAIQGQFIEKPFFGAPARLPNGSAMLAKRTGASLIGGHGWRSPGNRYYGEFVPISLKPAKIQQIDPEILMSVIIEKLEQFIGAYPEQWVVFAPIWTNDS